MSGQRAAAVTYAALVRAVNVAGYGKIAMADLRAWCAEIGYGEPRTLLNSGNLVFTATAKLATLEALLEREAVARLGASLEFFVRDAAAWRELVANNPFPDAARDDPGHLVVLFLKAAPAASAVEELRAAIVGRETIAVDGAHLYATYPDGIGESKLTNTLIERQLATRVTGRNWNTVGKIGALLGV